jgi:PAS domain S-box-containing protein
MGWLLGGILYSAAYVATGWLLGGHPSSLSWFRAAALLVPPVVGILTIVVRRQSWRGCQWLFWATIAVGLAMSAIGLTGWAADELVSRRETWLAWPSIFALFGGIAPLFALLAQPHRGAREPLAATTAVDLAGLTVVTGFLYSFFVTAPDTGQIGGGAPISLELVSELQQALVVAGMLGAAIVAHGTGWSRTYRRLAFGAMVGFATLTLSNFEISHGLYQSGFVYDFAWILPFAFFPWAATTAPASEPVDSGKAAQEELERPRPWVIFAAVAMIPILDFGLRRLVPDETLSSVRDLSTAVTLISVLSLLVARIAAERAEMQQVGSTTRLLADVLEQAQDLILVLTPEGRCRYANGAFCRAMGLTPEELTGLRAADLMTLGAVSTGDLISQVRAKGGWRGTVTRKRADGTTFPVSATLASLVDERGTLTHLVSVERDISEERRLREQLIHSERLSAVGQLVAGVAHEINNPLQAVMGLSELLIEGHESGDDSRHDLDQIRIHADRAARIVRHLLLFARRSALERSIADLNEIARSAVSLRSFELKNLGIELVEHYSLDLPLTAVNREEIQQVIVNLLLNAEHAVLGSGRPGVVRVGTGEAGACTYIEVADNGPGIPPALARQVFEPFFTTKGVGQGTGLGLSVSLGIAQAHGGTLELRPSDRGACFRLTLPRSSETRLELTDLPTSA